MNNEHNEIELKFLIMQGFPYNELFPPNVRISEIRQDYLENPDVSPLCVCRVRMETFKDGKKRYMYTEKRPTCASLFVRCEDERQIDSDRYFELLRLRCRPGYQPVRKTRYTFSLHGRTYELDVYHAQLDGLVTLEVEFDSEEELRSFYLPAEFRSAKVRNVTRDLRYQNAVLASLGLPEA